MKGLIQKIFGIKEENNSQPEAGLVLKDGLYAGTKIDKLSRLDLSGDRVLYSFRFIYDGKKFNGSLIGGKNITDIFDYVPSV